MKHSIARPRVFAVPTLLVAVSILASACSLVVEDDSTSIGLSTAPSTTQSAPVATSVTQASNSPITATTVPTALDPADTYALDRTRDDVDCTKYGLGWEEESRFSVAHVVVDGRLGQLCYGEEDQALFDAWDILVAVMSSGELRELALFGGFSGPEDTDDVTLAFVNIADFEGLIFQMSVNLPEAALDRNELALTLSHEYTHIMTAVPDQIDRFGQPDCPTYYNGEGCYIAGSLMDAWIAAFWGGGLLDGIDPEAEASDEDSQDRCDLNPGFFGAYGASSPEEDFAESFSAFVHQVPTKSAEQQARVDWFAAIPSLLAFRDRAEAADLSPLPNTFDPCGTG